MNKLTSCLISARGGQALGLVLGVLTFILSPFSGLTPPVFAQAQDNVAATGLSTNTRESQVMSSHKKGYSHAELFCGNEQRIFSGNALSEIAFPLGGIGAGNVRWEDADNCATGKFSTVQQKGGTCRTHSFQSGHNL